MLRPERKESLPFGSSDLSNQLAILSAKFAASEAESKALKERLTATESELAELRLKVKKIGSLNSTTDLASPLVALSPCDTTSPSDSRFYSPSLHHSH